MPWFTKPLLARDGLVVSFRPTCVAGTFVAETFWPRSPMPVCTRWFRWVDERKSTLEILNSYVPERLRRLGLSTWSFERAVARLRPRFVVTQRGTAFSEPWLKKMGFKHGKDGWTLTL